LLYSGLERVSQSRNWLKVPNDPPKYISQRSLALRQSTKEDGRGRYEDLPEITFDYVQEEATTNQLATEVQSIISAGKEATVYLALWKDHPLALKVYRLYSSPHARQGKRKKMGGRKVGFSTDIMSYWAAREFWILDRAFRSGVRVPAPARHCDIMFTARFLGDKHLPAPLLKDSAIDYPQRVFDDIIEQIFGLYRAFIIHGDLSAFNVIMFRNEPWIIDLPQAIDFASRPGRHAVLKRGRPILLRDIHNIINFFRRYGIQAKAEELCDECMSQISINDRYDPKLLIH
jgi:RIO kinase 1